MAARREQVIPALIAVLTVAFVGSLWPSFQNISGAGVAVGDDAPEFQLVSDAGRPIALKDFQGKFLVLNFWATWCPPCLEELPSLNRFHEQFAAKGLVVLGISVDEDANAYREFLKKAGVQFLTARDPEKKIPRTYGTFKYPETYFIDRQGKVVQKIIGARDWSDPQLVADVEQLLKG
jgi:cytochrome c biogenesis protein CcmG/thiol:disulfide interchange protein DsbE